MFSRLVKSFALGVLSLITVVVMITSIIFLSPVDPARLSFGQQLDEATLEAKRVSLGLDLPLTTQLRYYLRDISPLIVTRRLPDHLHEFELVRISLGFANISIKKPYLRESFQSGRRVVDLIGATLPQTLILALTSISLALLLGIVFGMLAAYNKGRWLDEALLTLSTLGYSVPSYVSAIFFALVFGYYLHSVTGLNLQGGLFVLNEVGDEVFMLRNLVLPALALGIRPVSVLLQITRSAALEVMDQPYVLLAVAKGLPMQVVKRKYVLRNALNPVLTATSGWFASLLSGAFFVESVFSFRGFGQLTVNALLNYDVPLLLGCILTVSLLFICINIGMDLLYRKLDPRIV
jgi:peptide/nickel transport system permease protein